MTERNDYKISAAVVREGAEIQKLVNRFADRGIMLPLSLSDVYDNIRDFVICRDRENSMLGVCALHICWENLAEIRSLAVDETYWKKGLGREMVLRALDEARMLGISQVFVLTYVPDFFAGLGFRLIPKSELPHKIWADCIKCPKFPNCDEESMVIDLE
jgi:amino-acid N-acetyltransferase